jgi:hypothetical protein
MSALEVDSSRHMTMVQKLFSGTRSVLVQYQSPPPIKKIFTAVLYQQLIAEQFLLRYNAGLPQIYYTKIVTLISLTYWIQTFFRIQTPLFQHSRTKYEPYHQRIELL